MHILGLTVLEYIIKQLDAFTFLSMTSFSFKRDRSHSM